MMKIDRQDSFEKAQGADMPIDVLEAGWGWISDPDDELAGYQSITIKKQIEKPLKRS